MAANRVLRTARHGARLRAFQLVHDLQAEVPTAALELAKLTAEAEENGWDEVLRACMFARVVDCWCSGVGGPATAVAQLVELSAHDGDPLMLALGLALRSAERFSGSDPSAATARDADLARAVVLLEQPGGGVLERISAHTACGIAFTDRWLFELGDEQYRTALLAGESAAPGTLDFILAPITFNLAETQVIWASVLRQLGDLAGVKARWRAYRAALSSARASFVMADEWMDELRAFGLMLASLAGEEVAEEAIEELARTCSSGDLGRRAVGPLRLAVAIVSASNGKSEAGELVAEALAAIDPAVHPQLYDLGLCLAAELEATGGETAGLRYGRRQLEEHWAKHQASLGSMRSRIQAERLANERELLTRYARLDDLTGVGNRRALEQHLSDLERREVRRIALILLDVDAFKAINDRHGHLAGDAVLVGVARGLERHLGPNDLAVRLGGDEFAVVLAETELDGAFDRAISFLTQFDEGSFEDVSPGLEVALSAGVAAGSPTAMTQLLAEADAALYRAKAGGGHRVLRSRLAKSVA